MAAASFGSVPGLTRNSRTGLDRFRGLRGFEDRAGAQIDAVAVLGPDLADDRRRVRGAVGDLDAGDATGDQRVGGPDAGLRGRGPQHRDDGGGPQRGQRIDVGPGGGGHAAPSGSGRWGNGTRLGGCSPRR